jgi:type III pantothenate kinase
MLIAIDIGNTRIKTGVLQNNLLTGFFSFTGMDEVLPFIKNNKDYNFAISSVVPDKTKIISEEINKISGKTPFIISGKIKTNLKVDYATPETLGTDRLCSAEGAFYLFKSSKNYSNYSKDTFIISLDLGTASTINIIEYPGNFIGGLISPGIKMMFESLKQRTAQLPHLDASHFISTVGNDTNSSIASGVITSAVGMIEKTINDLKKEKLAKKVFVYLTGGSAESILPYLNFNFVYEEGLVLYGINALWQLNNKI